MKKFFYTILAFAAVVACSKEKEAPVKEDGPVEGGAYELSINAFVDEGDLTKTSYAADGTFSWVQKDTIRVRLKNTVSGARSIVNMYAKSGGASTEFAVTLTADNYRPDSIAVYSPYKTAMSNTIYDGSSVRVSMPLSYHLDGANKAGMTYYNKVSFSSANPLSVLPLVGVQQQDGSFKFQTAVGVLHVQLTGLEDNAAGICINSAGGDISNYLMVRDGAISMGNAWYDTSGSTPSKYAANFVYYFFNQTAEHTASVYVPIPVGTLVAGSSIEVVDASGLTLFTKEFKKDVQIERNKVVELAPFKASEDWVSLGVGKYFDSFVWSYAGFPNEYVDVDIQYVPGGNLYKVINPYGAARTKYNYAPAGTVYDPSESLILSVEDDDYVYYDNHRTGVYLNANWTGGISITAPYTYSSSYSSYAHFGKGSNFVAKKNASGVAENIILSPVYEDCNNYYWTSNNYINAKTIQILMPGATPLDLTAEVAYVEIADDTPAQPIAKVNVAFGNAYKEVKVVIAADVTSALAALADASLVSVATSSGAVEVKFPADAASGKYAAYASFIAADGLSSAVSTTVVSDEFQYDRSDETWVDLGTGKYVDNNYWSSMGGSAGVFVDVPIIQNPNDASNFRVVNPYGAAATKFGYSPAVATTPSEYLDLTVQSDGTVIFVAHDTGIYNSSYKESTIMHSPYDFITSTGFNLNHNFVVKYASDGKPANIILAPVYYWHNSGYWTGTNYINNNDGVQIVFPGNEPLDAGISITVAEIVDDNPAQPIAKVLVDPGNAFASVDLAFATSDSEAATALADASLVVVATGTGEYELKLPADAPSGTYYVYGRTHAADGVSKSVEGLVRSDAFLYDRSDVNLGITPELIAGSYTAAVTINWLEGAGYEPDEISLVIEPSDDDNAGNIMFTNFIYDGVMYGYLKEETGEITVDPFQVLFTVSVQTGEDGGSPVYTDLDFVPMQFTHAGGSSLAYDMTNPLTFRYYKESKTIEVTSSDYLGLRCYYAGTSSAWGLWCLFTSGNADPDDYVTFTKDEAPSSAPKAKAAKKTNVFRKVSNDARLISAYVPASK